jgi:hypothetical protein
MAELADALDSGSSGLTALEVRVLFRAPTISVTYGHLSVSVFFVPETVPVDSTGVLARFGKCRFDSGPVPLLYRYFNN